MSDIPPITSNGAAAGKLAGSRPVGIPATAAPARPGDSLELSPMAQLLAKLADMPEVRTALVERVQREIEAGTYETPDKLDAALDALGNELAADDG